MPGRYKPYSEYKDSGVQWMGEIPSHWELIQSRRLFSQRKERARPEDEQLTSSQKHGVIFQKEYMELENQRVVQVISGPEILKHVEPNDFVISMRSFQGGLEWCKYSGSVSSAYIGLITIKHVVPEFFSYLFKCQPYIQALQSTSNLVRDGQALRFENFSQVSLPNIPDDEQRRIANFLDYEIIKIDTLIEKQQQLIKLLKEKRRSVISHAVTKGLNPDTKMRDSGVEWLGEVPEHWDVKRLKNTSEIVDCRNKTPEYFSDGDYFVVRTTNIKNQKLSMDGALFTDEKNFKIWTQRGIPPAGSILFTREAPAGEVCRAPENVKFCLGQRMMNFICNEEKYTDFLFDFLLSDCLDTYIKSVSHGSTVSHLRVEQVENIPVLVPPTDEAKKIHQYLSNIKLKYFKLTQRAEAAIALMQERRTALISAAVTGKIDVRNWVTPKESQTNKEVAA
ncbi:MULTISPECIES: restriction endonuclease subunit S [unclassified Pseudomonas]|uniref:restriction endonuclease subunit S n=1 Tax=unclassified Pseudomonas TaxID=196821 RepID=UPI002AC89F70|nr:MULTISPECIES: restriction endonuclease subunit S [unclassified Pseudomonas]MEB0048806.1 restriction endonuclease subunit S [Pseudomonas sp. Dout3]MEB0099620.1 restriction endonuclease subunit S [Pseudomonas sp. DC1.2]WPX59668.1 restriction endonuclease subunit S [Pseudomonas sp. DC1.2]